LLLAEPAEPQAPAQTEVTIEVLDADTGVPLDEFRYLINEDNTHQAASTTNPASYSPVVATGTHTDTVVSLPAGKYLVTVLSGPFPPEPSDYKLWGKPFEVNGTGSQTVTVMMTAENPLPLVTLRAKVFHDNNPVNAFDDSPIEPGLGNFKVVASDPVGEVTVDWWGNPICTEYDGNPAGSTPLGDPIPGSGGECFSGSDGMAVIPNLPPGKYEVEVVPPDGEGWVQTTTIEGTKAIDAWLEEGASGYSTEVGFLTAAVWFGFVQPCEFGDTTDSCPTNDVPGTGTIMGTVRQISLDTDAPGVADLGKPVSRPFIALNNVGGNDEQVYLARGNPDGTFQIDDVPEGLYQVVYWDFPLDYIIAFRNVQVGAGETVDMGDIGIARWFGTIAGYVYEDTGVARDGTVIPGGTNNGIRDCYDDGDGIDPHDVATCEPGIPGQALTVHFKDGSVAYDTFTDSTGYYEFAEYFEWEHFLVWEVGFGRRAQVATAAYGTDDFGDPIGYPDDPVQGPVFGGPSLLQAQLTWAGQTTWIDSGKRTYAEGENGGVSGAVWYGVTRNELDPRYALAEPYEPGIPNVPLKLYKAEVDEFGAPIYNADGSVAREVLVNTVQTDSWYDDRPTNCTIDPLYGGPSFVDPQCLELPRTWQQVKTGVFDGGYAIEESCVDPDGLAVTDPDGDADVDGTPNKLDPDLLLDPESGACEALEPGRYVVEVEPPENYKHITENDINTEQGDEYVPAVPPPPCAGPYHEVTDPSHPSYGTMQPLCDRKLVDVRDGFNAGAEFFLMTDNATPPPGYLRGMVLDDLVLQQDPNSPLYVEKRGVPNAPVGILDYAGNEITRVHADENGYWEVLLPSSYSAHCPTPGGVCPAMYQVIGNYPGDPANPDPNYNPNYSTLSLVFDVWPGKTTYADVAIVPITNFIVDPDSGYQSPPVCEVPDDTPNVLEVSQPYGPVGSTFTITGTNFGETEGEVTLGGTPISVTTWSDTVIDVTASGVSPGPQQLLVTAANGNTSPTGLTYHVTGGGYDPTVIPVGASQTYTTVQSALDAASDGDLIVVEPGTYYETLIFNKNVKLQGYGPGATVLDGRFFNFGGLTPQEFISKTQSLAYDGPPDVPMGQVVTVLAQDGVFTSTYTTQIDGFAIRGGNVARGNIGPDVTQQGGGIYAHAYARWLEVSNNLIQGNSGNGAGGVILGQAYVTNPDAGDAADSENDDVHIHHNRVLNNGGFLFGGGIGLFNGAQDYEIDHNTVCGNYSVTYGGGISHFGVSPGGWIHDNQVLFNGAFDEGGGLMIAGELPQATGQVSAGSGDVMIERNLIEGNYSNDDGGGIRMLQPVTGPITITNNMVVNNLATDAGGGVSVDDALDVKIINNTIARNISTATAEDADRSTCSPPQLGSCPHAAGLAAEPHSAALMATLPLTATDFSYPVLFNNIFWENEAYYLDGAGGLSSAGVIDLEVIATETRCFDPRYSILTSSYAGCTLDPSNEEGADPMVVDETDLRFDAIPFAGDPQFVSVLIESTPSEPLGDYHLSYQSPAIDAGTAASGTVSAPADDFDGQSRPQTYNTADFDIGADEVLTDTEITGLQATNDSPTSLGQLTTLEADVDTGNNLWYTWDLGDGTAATGASLLHEYPSIGFYTATVTAENSTGSSSAETVVEIVDAPIRHFGVFNDGPTPLGDATTLTATLSSGTNVDYAWDFGDGDQQTGNDPMVSHTYDSPGDYTVTVTGTNSVSQAVASTVVVVDETIMGLSATDDSPTAWGNPTTLTATVDAGSRVEYIWYFGDGKAGTGSPVSHTYLAPGAYTAYVTARNSVSELTVSTDVRVTEVPITGLQAFNDSPTLLGLPTTLTATITSGSNVSYVWDLGDATTATGRLVVHTYPTTGTFTATVTAMNASTVVSATTPVEIRKITSYLPFVMRTRTFIP
jgi:PKD repeat protein